MLTGGCFCGKVRYEAGGEPFDLCLCHCESCRKTTGAPAVAWMSVRPEAFRFTAGEPAAFASSDTGLRRFCRDCGAQLTFQDSRLDEVDVATASLDDPSAAAPQDQIWVQSRLPWMAALNSLPELPRGHGAAPARSSL
jgi:hypothetical protein